VKLFRFDALATMRELRLTPRTIAAITLLSFSFAALEGVGTGLMWPVLLYVESGAGALASRMPYPLNLLFQKLADAGWLNLVVLLGILFAVLLLREVIRYQRVVLVARRAQDFFVTLLEEVSEALLLARFEYHRMSNRGTLQSRLFNDTRYAAQLVLIWSDYFVSFLLALAYLGVMCIINWKLTAFLLPVFGAVRLSGHALSRNASSAGSRVSRGYADLSRGMTEVLQNIAFVKSRFAEEASLARILRLADDLADGVVAQERLKAFASGMSQPLLFLGTLVGIYIAVDSLGLRFAELAIFVFVLTRLIALYSSVVSLAVQYKIGVQSLHVLNDLIRDAGANRHAEGGTRQFAGLRDAIRLENVSFAYRAGRVGSMPALDDVSLRIGRGQFVAIVGRSGAGKSTLAGLIVGFLTPSQGRLFFDDVPATEFQPASLRRHVALVEQDPVMFDESIRANLTFGVSPPPSDDELMRVLELVQARDFVTATSHGLDTVIGERGAMVSGGQRQRLALARALCAKPDILILDEPTSALDPETDAAIRRLLVGLKDTITTIVIAHRLSTVRDADCIFCLEQGRLVDEGRFSELAARSAAFARVFGDGELAVS
jgi:ABC-type multidrug transport system fused ATPase/permease subunit